MQNRTYDNYSEKAELGYSLNRDALLAESSEIMHIGIQEYHINGRDSKH